MRIGRALVWLLIAIFPCTGETAGLGWPRPSDGLGWQRKRAAIGREKKFRVLVDKVLSRSNDWVMTDQHIREIQEAGFNVVVPRVGGTDIQRVRRVAAMAKKHGMFYMAWMRGTLKTRVGTGGHTKLVWENGVTQDLYSPNANELWDWMTENILGHARVGADNPAVIGTFLDFENYAEGRVKNCYFLSYDDKIMAEFARAKGLQLPNLEPDRRKGWLVENGQFNAFKKFQVSSWRKRCRELRQRIDAINPYHQLIVYPIGTMFLEEAIYGQWSTQQAPLIVAGHSTYGRKRDFPHPKALQWNRRTLLENLQYARSKDVPLLYMGGIDPVVKGADPEFCGKNAVMISEVTDGYWVFYEGLNYREPEHSAYFKWFSWANDAIAEANFALWKQHRQEPDPALQAQRELLEKFCGADVRPYTTESMPRRVRQITYTTRGKNYFCILLEAGEKLQGQLEAVKIGQYDSVCELMLFGPDRQQQVYERVEAGRTISLNYLAKTSGLHVIIVDSDRNAARLFVSNQYFCLLTTEPISLIGKQPESWFLPVPKSEHMVISLSSPSPGETVLMTVLHPDGSKAVRIDTITNSEVKAKLELKGAPDTKPWSLRLTRAPAGVLEDLTLGFGAGCGDFMASHPCRLLMPGACRTANLEF